MSVRELLASASLTQSPIGHIPKDFPRLVALCKRAHIRFRDIQTEDIKLRDWSVVVDPNPGYKGSTSTRFQKFCIVLDYLTHLHPTWTRRQILDAALDGTDAKARALPDNWKDAHNFLAREGVYGYDVLQSKTKPTQEIDL